MSYYKTGELYELAQKPLNERTVLLKELLLNGPSPGGVGVEYPSDTLINSIQGENRMVQRALNDAAANAITELVREGLLAQTSRELVFSLLSMLESFPLHENVELRSALINSIISLIYFFEEKGEISETENDDEDIIGGGLLVIAAHWVQELSVDATVIEGVAEKYVRGLPVPAFSVLMMVNRDSAIHVFPDVIGALENAALPTQFLFFAIARKRNNDFNNRIIRVLKKLGRNDLIQEFGAELQRFQSKVR